MKVILAAASAVALMAAAAPSLAQDAQQAAPAQSQGPRMNFQMQDQTLAQALERAVARFDRSDLNKDGRVTAEEMAQARAANGGQGGPGGQGGGQGGQGGGGGGGGRGGLARADADGDGVITRAEIEAQTRARFERQDTDKNGTVTVAEMQAGRQN